VGEARRGEPTPMAVVSARTWDDQLFYLLFRPRISNSFLFSSALFERGGRGTRCRGIQGPGVGGRAGTKKDDDGAEPNQGKGRAEDQLAGEESEDKGRSA
jgi:hypothetical protein